jgi:hypothetical protein
MSKKKNRLKNDLQALGIDIENIPFSGDPQKLPSARESFAMLRHYAKRKGYKSAWALVQHKSIFGSWPARRWHSDPLIIPNFAVLGYIQAAARNYHLQKESV